MATRPEPAGQKTPPAPFGDTREAPASPSTPPHAPAVRDDGKLPAEAFWKAAGRFQRLR